MPLLLPHFPSSQYLFNVHVRNYNRPYAMERSKKKGTGVSHLTNNYLLVHLSFMGCNQGSVTLSFYDMLSEGPQTHPSFSIGSMKYHEKYSSHSADLAIRLHCEQEMDIKCQSKLPCYILVRYFLQKARKVVQKPSIPLQRPKRHDISRSPRREN